jgi:hypothetical protein
MSKHGRLAVCTASPVESPCVGGRFGSGGEIVKGGEGIFFAGGPGVLVNCRTKQRSRQPLLTRGITCKSNGQPAIASGRGPSKPDNQTRMNAPVTPVIKSPNGPNTRPFMLIPARNPATIPYTNDKSWTLMNKSFVVTRTARLTTLQYCTDNI